MNNNSVRILGVKINKVNIDEAYNLFLNFMERDKLSMIFTPNTEIVMKAQEDQELKDILFDADLVIPDGIGLLYASKLHGLGLEERVTGIDLMDKILNYCNNTKRSIYIFGGKPEVAKEATDNILKKYPNIKIAGYSDGYYKDKEAELKIIDKINESKPDVLFVALGAPKQEKWIYNYRKILNTKVAMGVGGSVDVWAGRVKRAPELFRKIGMEWLYRLLKEPFRVVRMMALPKFLIKILISKDFQKQEFM